MSDLILSNTSIRNGVCFGMLQGVTEEPKIAAHCGDIQLPKVDVTQTEEGWQVQALLPVEVINEGTCTVLFTDMASGSDIGHISIVAGEALADDLRAEVALLRAELDLLKRAFRRHCSETS
ncbi:MAG: hypothetical protein ABJL99_05605 [Aliishimia sp.]